MTQTQYKIIRFYFADSKPNKIIKRGLTLDQAQGHWFDGYDEDK